MGGFLSGRTSLTTVQTADIADDAITEAKMATDAIGITELKAGTDGNIISYDASGDPVAIATGDDGQILTSAGAGAQPAFETLSAGFTQSAVTATTSGTAVTLTGIPSGTKVIYLMANAVSLSTHDSIDLTIGDSGGLETSGYSYTCKELTSGGSLTASAASPGAKWEVYGANAGTQYSMRGMGWITLADASSFLYHFSYLGTRDTTLICTSGLKTLSAEITQISFGGGTFDNGSFSLLYI